MEKYNILADPEANILYQKCRDVDDALWEALSQADPAAVERRTGAHYQAGAYTLPFLNRKLTVHPVQRLVQIHGQSQEEPEFQLCLTCAAVSFKGGRGPIAFPPGQSQGV